MRSLSEIWQQVQKMFSNQEDSLNEDDSLLDNLDETYTSFCRTPLHVAVMSGDIEFATKILSLKPDLALTIDSTGFTPLHLASVRTNLRMVRLLLHAKAGACIIQDEDGRTPLHLAAMKNRVEVMKVLMEEGLPEAIHLKNGKNGETILHLCVKSNSNLKTLELLAGYLVPAQPPYPNSVSIDSTDNDDNTILHLAVEMGNMKITNYLLLNSNVRIDINVVNTKGIRALNMLSQAERNNLEFGFYDYHAPRETHRSKTLSKNGDHGGLKDRVNALMVVATLIAGIAFQAAMNPPGGVWQDDSRVDSDTDPVKFAYYLDTMYSSPISGGLEWYMDRTFNSGPRKTGQESNIRKFVGALMQEHGRGYFTMVSNGLLLGDYFTHVFSNYKNITANSSDGVFFPYLIRYAGYPILAYTYPTQYVIYMATNGIAFFVSLAIIFLVVCGFTNETSVLQVRVLIVLMCISIGCIAFGYLSTLQAMIPHFYSGAVDVFYTLNIFLGICCILGVGSFIRSLAQKIGELRKRTRHHHIRVIDYLKTIFFGMDAKAAGKLILFIVCFYSFLTITSYYMNDYNYVRFGSNT